MLVSGEGSKTSEVMQRKGAVPICGVLARRGVRNVQLWNRHALISAVTYCYGQAPYIAVGYCYGYIWFGNVEENSDKDISAMCRISKF